MDITALKNIAQHLMSGHKGLLAMDESTPTCNKRFAALNIPQTEEYRRKYRELIVTTPDLEKYISGAILFDETIRQSTPNGIAFIDILLKKGIVPGIKVDEGTVPMAGFPGEKVTEGLDGLRQRLAEYYQMGARFAKWRAVIAIDNGIPTTACIKTNAHILARYAALCQEAGLVPIVEPEVLMDGDHTLKQCAEVTEKVLHAVFHALQQHQVHAEGLLLKPNMVLPGKDCPQQNDVEEIATATINTLLRCVPAAVAGVAFLSGGQSADLASERLNMMHRRYEGVLPWALTFSFSRAIQQHALELWKGDDANIVPAQKELVHRAACNNAARKGEYTGG